MDALLLFTLFVPLIAAAALAGVPAIKIPVASWFNALTTPLVLGSAIAIALRLAADGAPVVVAGWWRVDALSALLVVLIATVVTLTVWLGPGLERDNAHAMKIARPFRIYANLFAATMLMAVCTDNLGLMWVAIEATTVTSVLLVPASRTKAAVEASWKYLIIGSVGIALAFAGTVLAFVDYASSGGDVSAALNWTTLRTAAPSLHPEVARLAFAFLLVGFGTKAGLVPMHTWLPDAHSEAPAPLSAMMSGVLLAVALYALARWKAIVDLAVGSAFGDTLLITIAIATVLVGSLSLVVQRRYKRLLAYSSVEHMGLACFGLALGPLGVFAALFHLTGHALAKSVAFLLSGRVLERYDTQTIADTSGVLTALPRTGGLLAAGLLALIGLPPFGLFVSEILLVQAGLKAGHPVLTAIVVGSIAVAFASVVNHGQRMLLGTAPAQVRQGERAIVSPVMLSLPLVALAWIGVAVPASLYSLLTRATEVLRP